MKTNFKKNKLKKQKKKENRKRLIKLICFTSVFVILILISSLLDPFFVILPTVNYLKFSFSYLVLWIFLPFIGLYLTLLGSFIAIIIEFWFFHLNIEIIPFIGYLAKLISYFLFILTSFYLLKIIKYFSKKYLKMTIFLLLLIANIIFLSLTLTFLNYIFFIPVYKSEFPSFFKNITIKAILGLTFIFNLIQFTIIYTISYLIYFSYFQKVLNNLKKNYNL